MAKQRIVKSEKIPKLGTAARNITLDFITGAQTYIESISKGWPFFTKDELNDIENEYKDGLTWEEIEAVMSKKGNMLKYATFRKYIQNKIIPKSIGHKSTENGRVAIYPKNIIAHLNYVNFFYNVTDTSFIDSLIEYANSSEISYLEALDSEMIDNYGKFILALCDEITGVYSGTEEATWAVETVLANHKEDMEFIVNKIAEIKKKYEKHINKDVEDLMDYLRSKKMLISEIPETKQENLSEEEAL